jgi:hypothetical protein
LGARRGQAAALCCSLSTPGEQPAGRGRFASGYAVGDPVGVTLPELLAPLGHVDYLDLDIQVRERECS